MNLTINKKMHKSGLSIFNQYNKQENRHKNEHQLVQRIGPSKWRTFTAFMPLRIKNVNKYVCDCPNVNIQAPDIAEIRDGFMFTSFTTGKVYISFQGAMEDHEGNLLVLDHIMTNSTLKPISQQKYKTP